MQEWIAALITLWCGITYWLGGQELPILKRGYKWIRRYLLPAGLLVGLRVLDVPWLHALGASTGLTIALHLGYGSSVKRYLLTGLAMALPASLIGFHWTIILPVTYHTIYGWISLKDNRFKWAYVALLMGISLGIAYTSAIK